MPATSASIAKLRARASVHSTTGSLRRKKRTITMPGQTKRNQNTMKGRMAISVNTKFTRPAAIAERMMMIGHNRFDSGDFEDDTSVSGTCCQVSDIDGAGVVGKDCNNSI